MQLNMVTKRGTNGLRGSGRYFMTDKQRTGYYTVDVQNGVILQNPY